MQQLTCKMVWYFSFNALVKSLNFKRSPGGTILKKCEKSVESVKKCRNDFALQFLPFSFSLIFPREKGSAQANLSPTHV